MTKKKDAIAVVPSGSSLPAEPREQCYSVELFISQAIEKNLPVETMERLLAMRTQLKQEQALEAYHRAVSEFQGRCPIIEKKKKVYEKGTTQKEIKDGTARVRYSYAPLDSIVEQTADLMRQCGLSHRVEVLNEDKFISVTCYLIHELGHSEASMFRVPIDFGAYMTEQQKYAAALTYAKRYAFCAVTGILTGDEDNDANSLDVETKPASATVQPTAPKPSTTAPPKPAVPAPTKPVTPPAPTVNPDDAKKQRIIKLMRDNGLQPTTSTKEGWEDAVKRNLGMDLKPENYDKIISVLEASMGGPPPEDPKSPPAGQGGSEALDATIVPPKPATVTPEGNATTQKIIDTFGGVEVPATPVSATMADWRRAAGDCKNTAEALELIKAMENAGEKKMSISMIRGVLAGRNLISQ